VITVTRLLVRQLRSVLRRAGITKPSRVSKNSILVRTGPDGLHVRAMSDQVAVEYHQPGPLPADEVLAPFELLAAAEGRGQEPVTLEPQGSRNVLASWNDHDIPQVIEFDTGPLADSKFPTSPDSFETNAPQLREALNLAAMITDNDPHRYALNCLQLRGGEGKIVATDGRQILVQFGFRFPWTDDLLVGASPVFACRELSEAEGVQVGIADDWIAFKIGLWTVWLLINREGRFPKLGDLFRQPAAATSRMSIDESDAEFLTEALIRLPSDHEQNNPVTLDLNGQVVVRARPAGQTRPTELILSHSQLHGENVVINTNRDFLGRAVKMGFREVYFFGPQSPALCDDGRRQYLWAVLEPQGSIKACDDAIRIESSTHAASDQALHPKPDGRRFNVIHPVSNSTSAAAKRSPRPAADHLPAENGHSSAIVQTVALRAVLRETLANTNMLIRALKREKRQNRLVASTLASLKQLQKVAS
jgi:hypothetical protein